MAEQTIRGQLAQQTPFRTDLPNSQNAQPPKDSSPSARETQAKLPSQGQLDESAKAQDNSTVNAYIISHNGCQALGRSWEDEFRRSDKAPTYGKPALTWDQADFTILRKWVGKCLDPFIVSHGSPERYLQMYDSKVKVYLREQEEAREGVRRKQQYASEQEARLQPLILQYQSMRSETDKLVQQLEGQAPAFLEESRALKLVNIDKVIAGGRDVMALGSKAQTSISETSTFGENLSRMLQRTEQPNHQREKDIGFEQSSALFERAQRAYGPVQTSYGRLERIQSRYSPCSRRLTEAAVPREIIETKIFSAAGDEDSYLFEIICPSQSTRLVYAGPSASRKMIEIELGTTPVKFWFDLRDDDGSKTWERESAGSPNPSSRLVLRRVKAGSTDQSAQANWESVNLLQTAALLLALAN